MNTTAQITKKNTSPSDAERQNTAFGLAAIAACSIVSALTKTGMPAKSGQSSQRQKFSCTLKILFNMSNDTLQSILGSKTVSFYSIFAKALGSVQSAVMLSQAFFWQEKARFKSECIEIKGQMFFKKTAEEWYEETGLTQEQQSTARAKLSKCGVMLSELAGLPASLHYWVDMEAVVKMVEQYLKENKKVFADKRTEKRDKKRSEKGKFEKTSNGKEPEHSIGNLPKQDNGIIPQQVDHTLPQQDTVKNGNYNKEESLEKKGELKGEGPVSEKETFVTTFTPDKIEYEKLAVTVVEGETFSFDAADLETAIPAGEKIPALQNAGQFEASFPPNPPPTPKKAREHDSPILRRLAALSSEKDQKSTDDRMIVQGIIAHLNQKTGSRFSDKSKVNWALILARIKEGATFDDLLLIIDHKTSQWATDAKMTEYLCPETLFRAGHYEKYINAARKWRDGITVVPCARYSMQDCPIANTPERMTEEISRFYNANKEIYASLLRHPGMERYTVPKLKEAVSLFCASRIKQNRGGETFQQQHAALEQHFLYLIKREREAQQAGPQSQPQLRSAAPVKYSID